MTLLSNTVFGVVQYFFRKWICNFVFKILNKNKSHFWRDLVVEMDDEELYVPDNVLEEASVARHQMLPKKSKPVSERQWVKNDVKWSERKRNLHPLVTMDTDRLSREISNKIFKRRPKCHFVYFVVINNNMYILMCTSKST
jgi:hypothetical protein